jgi:branched-chain amino acid transport system permease protein
MTAFLAAVGAGLGNGATYALLGLGFVMIYKATHVVSFAQPAFMMSGAVLASYLTSTVGFVAALTLSAVGIAILAMVVERLVVRPMVGKAVFVIAMLTMGIDIVVRIVAGAFLGLDPRVVDNPWGIGVIHIAGIPLAERHVATLVAGLVIVGALLAFFRFTRTGLAMRAAALDQEAATAQGIDVGMVYGVSWGLAGGLAAVAGVFAATGTVIDANFWLIALVALPAIVLGGIDSFGGAIVGGLIIGVVQAVASTYQRALLPEAATNVGAITPYVVMFLVLLIRPHGLFGTREVARV